MDARGPGSLDLAPPGPAHPDYSFITLALRRRVGGGNAGTWSPGVGRRKTGYGGNGSRAKRSESDTAFKPIASGHASSCRGRCRSGGSREASGERALNPCRETCRRFHWKRKPGSCGFGTRPGHERVGPGLGNRGEAQPRRVGGNLEGRALRASPAG